MIYADDTVLLATSPFALQKLLDICVDYFSSHNLVISMKKTKCLSILPLSLQDMHVPSIYIGMRRITVVREEKYLGVTVCSDRNDDTAIRKETRALYYRGNMLYRKFKGCSEDIKIQLFSSYCFSFYCSSLWSRHKRATITAIKVAYNNIFRLLFHIPRRVSIQ